MATIALVDDDRNILTSVSIMLRCEGFEVECHADGLSALNSFEREAPDLAVLDVRMPRMDGMDLLKRIRELGHLPVIMLTSRGDEVDEALGLRLGADDYIRKPFSQRLLLERIRAVLRRAQASVDAPGDRPGDQVVTRGDLKMDAIRHEVSWKGLPVTLTVTEFLLLQALASRPGHVKSRDQLMDVVYADRIYVDDRTIDSHMKRIRKKFRSIDAGFSAIETLYGIGYRYGRA